ncbi:MAG TPA: DUF308 domain-containing protein [Thermoplasmata archaeon]|nr:DUF308 domain-containing protein [Thermoplasmata archaeon]
MNSTSAPIGPASTPPPAAGPQPTWHRALEIFAGVLAIGLAAIALADPGLGLALAVFLFALALLWLGLWRLTRAWARPDRKGWQRGLDGAAGTIAIVLAFLVIAVPFFAVVALLVLIVLLCVGFMLIGFSWLGVAAGHAGEPGWYRGMGAVLGAVGILAAVVVLFDTVAALLTLVLLLAVGLILLGLADLVSGITGRPFRSPFTIPTAFRPPPSA